MVVSQVEGLVTLTVDGIDVEKRVETEKFPRPATVFDLRSTRDDVASVRLMEPIPDEIDVGDVGFHADHGDEHWAKNDSALVFEYELAPGEEYSTLYAIHNEDAPLDAFLTEPDLEVSGPTESLTERPTRIEVPSSGDDGTADDTPVEDASNEADMEAAPSAGPASDEAAPTAESPPDEAPVNDHAANPTGSPVSGEDDADDEETGTELPTAPASSEAGADGVVDELLRELREGTVDEDTRAALRSELQLSQGSVDARLRRLQSDVADLRAYTDALETFLDENGSGQQLLEDLRGDLERVENDLASVNGRIDSNENELDSINYSIAEIDGEIDSLKEEVTTVDESLAELHNEVDALAKDVPDEDLAGRLDAVESKLDSVRSWQEHVKSAFEASFDMDSSTGNEY